ncbi:HHL073Cp [Eremothecium sinecaudum]|uniref:HHL073Cp n=1 Tax=Eremothecium sinecaudum TaxID=45286 RepID=A0A109V0F8_9SACH|nr:HHL073Cp [Eremothecium sinecaudum]AMD22697.1 HHL073Cp [Eremothecium sinecaudum]
MHENCKAILLLILWSCEKQPTTRTPNYPMQARQVPVPPKNAPPAGYEKIAKTIEHYEQQLKELQSDTAPTALSTRADEQTWKIFRIINELSRYIYSLYYKRRAISKELYNWLLHHRYGDKNLIAKWKKQGYEKLCCIRCIQSTETQYGTTCICRVPRAVLEKNSSNGVVTFKNCVHCGCNGCASTD